MKIFKFLGLTILIIVFTMLFIANETPGVGKVFVFPVIIFAFYCLYKELNET